MTFICPYGHESAMADYCDQCGARIEAPPAMPPVPEPEPVPPVLDEDEDSDTARSPAQPPCPVCKTPRASSDRYCEVCAYDWESGVPLAVWQVVVMADRAWFERYSNADALDFPDRYEEWRLELNGERVAIGRSREGSDAPGPEIDLVGERFDPGISRAHAVLLRQDDGAFAVVDCKSTNGTAVNDDPKEITPDVPIALKDGDSIHVGAWTKITLCRRGSPNGG
jgi:hypothetical protein